MLPEFGSGLPEFLFAPNIDATHSLLVERTREALEIWEPRINIDRVEATADPKDPQTAILTIAYRLVATNQPDEITLAVPTTA